MPTNPSPVPSGSSGEAAIGRAINLLRYHASCPENEAGDGTEALRAADALEGFRAALASRDAEVERLKEREQHAGEIVDTVREAIAGTEFDVPGLRLSQLAAHAIRQAVSCQKALAAVERERLDAVLVLADMVGWNDDHPDTTLPALVEEVVKRDAAVYAALAESEAALASRDAEIARLREDAARLDWLEQKNAQVRTASILPSSCGYSVRDYIDGMIRAESRPDAARALPEQGNGE